MSVSRRGFLKLAGAGVAAVAASKGLEELLESPFEKLWEMMHAYVKGDVSWGDIVKFNNEYVGDIDFGKSSAAEIRAYFVSHGKYYGNNTSRIDTTKNNTLLGRIAPEGVSSESFTWNGETLDYLVVPFEQEASEMPVRTRALWDKHNNYVCINMTYTGSILEDIYNSASKMPSGEDLRFKDFMAKEFYDLVLEESRKEHPLLYFMNKKAAFKRTGSEILKRQSIIHERMHHWYPYPDDSDAAKEALFKEKETYLFQASHDKFNSYVFYITAGSTGNFYKAFEDAGISKNDLMNMKPEERARVTEELIR